MTKCNFDRTRLILYRFNELAPAEQEEVAAHLKSCKDCALEVEQMNSVLDRWPSQQIVAPPALQIRTKKSKRALARQPRLTRKARRLIPAIGFAVFLAIIAFSVLWRLGDNKSSNYWSLENSWEGPYRYYLEQIDRSIETIKNDKFFN